VLVDDNVDRTNRIREAIHRPDHTLLVEFDSNGRKVIRVGLAELLPEVLGAELAAAMGEEMA
jgi:hypothetical protein